ncbi:MAG: PEGA domain-containing protein, partial [Solirubrobacteraceae bacterium]|nr:PEGA domain-containing protein [Solirubrobacteraceae bacterium]
MVFSIFTTPDAPAAGTSFTIEAQIANTGPDGKVRAVFKVDGTQISDQNSTLVKFQDPGRVLWKPTATYTMPNKTITITIEAYGWDGSKWVLTDTKSITRTPAVTPCSGVTLTPFVASIKAGEKVTFTAAVTPSTAPFTVQFKDRAGTLLGTCTTSGGSCTFIWDSAGKPTGTYYVRAYVAEGGCPPSTESVIEISPALRQWNVNIYARDSTTGNPIEGATVTVGTQNKATDTAGFVQFRVDEGTIDISISKTGYNTKTAVELVFSDKTFNYVLSPTGIAKGNIHFVTVPAGADVYLDGNPQGVKTPVTVTDIPAGEHTFTLKLAGYNDLTGPVTVVGGSTVEVYAVMTPSTPGTGSLYINSSPVNADVIIDGQPQDAKTPATITNLTAGSHEVKLTRTGYEDFTTTVTITAGTTTYLSATMTVLPGIGTLEISSTPAGARVFIDGADAQKV